jgi:hypothetical protein
MPGPARLRTAALGLLISGGAVLLAWGCERWAVAVSGASGRGSLASLAVFALTPALVAYGLTAAARGLLCEAPLLSRRTLFWTGLLMLVAGAFPWAYTGWLVGGRPGNEGAGMLGTLLFLFVGIPGFTLTVVGLLAGWHHAD